MATEVRQFSKVLPIKKLVDLKNNYDSLYSNYVLSLRNATFTLSNRLNKIKAGRKCVTASLDVYKNNSNATFLMTILSINETILPLYIDSLRPGEPISDIEKYLIEDKCKYFYHSILVMFHLNMMNRAKNELTAFKKHLHVYDKYIRSEYSEIYENMRELFNSFTFVSVFDDETKCRDEEFYGMGFRSYELRNDYPGETYRLHRAVIVGSCATQVPLAQMTIDMFRMSHAIEWNPMKIKALGVKNARKWTFYNSKFWDIERGINDASHNMSGHGVLLLYLSGDGFEKTSNLSAGTRSESYRYGVRMKQEVDETVEHDKTECMYPGDVASLLLKPTVIVIDSAVSHAFLDLHKDVSVPVLTLLSPTSSPPFIGRSMNGNLYTLFLTSPQTAFCWVCHSHRLPRSQWRPLLQSISEFMDTLLDLLRRWHSRATSDGTRSLLGDPFCRAFLLRHLFCLVTLKLHSQFDSEHHYPRSNIAALEFQATANRRLHALVYRMAAIVGGADFFVISSDLSASSESIDVEK